MAAFENICPACKTKNETEAVVCVSCGARLDDAGSGSGHRTKTTDMQAPTPEMIRDWTSKEAAAPEAPKNGIAVYVEGRSDPACIETREEFILGRRSESTSSEMLVDLAPFGGYTLGVSRRHVIVRRTGDGYEVMDLGSVNGTYLNDERLTPHKSYALPSGSYLRLARMRVLALYRPSPEPE